MYKTENFSPEKDPFFTCPCCKKGGLSIPLLIVLEVIKAHFEGRTVHITSGARCEKHNKTVGGSLRSEHLITEENPLSDAADVCVDGVSTQELYLFLKSLPYANLLGIGKYKGRVHIDTRGYAARWSG